MARVEAQVPAAKDAVKKPSLSNFATIDSRGDVTRLRKDLIPVNELECCQESSVPLPCLGRRTNQVQLSIHVESSPSSTGLYSLSIVLHMAENCPEKLDWMLEWMLGNLCHHLSWVRRGNRTF
jgi:hypothetical protein